MTATASRQSRPPCRSMSSTSETGPAGSVGSATAACGLTGNSVTLAPPRWGRGLGGSTTDDASGSSRTSGIDRIDGADAASFVALGGATGCSSTTGLTAGGSASPTATAAAGATVGGPGGGSCSDVASDVNSASDGNSESSSDVSMVAILSESSLMIVSSPIYPVRSTHFDFESRDSLTAI